MPFALAMTLLTAGLPTMSAPAASAAGTIASPFSEGQSVRIIQGYNGGSHRGRSQYGLDLVLADGGTSGATVVSPIEGSVTWAQGPGASNGCIAVTLRDSSYSVMLCHLILERGYRPGEAIARGQQLGTVGPAGSVGNNGAPHVHLELHRGRGANSPVPFSEPDGLPLEGVHLPASGASGEHTGRTPVGRAATAARQGGASLEAQSQTALRSITPPTSDVGGRSPRSVQLAPAPAVVRAAVVRGTGSCLNVRERAAADARIVECLPEGAEVPLESVRGGVEGWRQIETKGWAVSEYLKPTRAVVARTDGCLNVRERPSVGAPVIGCLAEGAAVSIAEGPTPGDSITWYRIERVQPLERGGWVGGQYLD
jgi:Bacterial SH3 domain/Peptidase family M23